LVKILRQGDTSLAGSAKGSGDKRERIPSAVIEEDLRQGLAGFALMRWQKGRPTRC